MDLRESFLHPPTEVRPRPLWLVEGDPSQERLEWLCGQLREKGLGGAFLLPRPDDALAPAACAQIVRLGDAMGLVFRVLTASARTGELGDVARALDAFTWDEATPHHLKHVADLLAISGQQVPLPWPLRSRVATAGYPPYAVSLFYQSPAWPYLGKLADYVARLNLIAQSGERLPGGAGLGTENTSLKAACWRSGTEAMVFVVNTGLQWTKGKLAAPQAGRTATLWNLEDGSIRPAAVNDAGEIVLHLAPMESRLYVFGPQDPALGNPAEPLHEEARLALTTEGYHFTPYGGNFLRLTPDDFGAEEASAAFRTTKPLANLRILADTAALEGATLLIDGAPLPPAKGWEMDLGLGSHALPKPLVPGGHLVELRAAPDGPPAPLLLAQHVWLAGDFVAEESGAIPELSPVPTMHEGAWETNGLAHFSGTAAYTADLDLPASARGKQVHLDAGYVADVLEVEVNGQRAGERLWPPYVVDITAQVRPGERNLVVLKVTNSLRNFLAGPDPAQPSGLLESVEIVVLR
jgi:hypothetical protein